MKTTLTALLLIGSAMHAFADTKPIGFKNISVPDAQRPLQIVVWYPAATTANPELIHDDAVFFGALAVPDAPAASGEHPLVVLSHGYGGEGPTGR